MHSDPAELVVIGKITGVFGIRGWLKVHSYTEPRENFLQYPECFIKRGGQWQSVQFAEGKPHGKGLVVRIDGIDDRDQAAAYGQAEVAVQAHQLPPLDEQDFYWHQLEGLLVRVGGQEPSPGDRAPLLGIVDHLIATGANDVLVVKGCSGSIDQRERLIPYLPDQVVQLVDLASGVIWVNWDPEF